MRYSIIPDWSETDRSVEIAKKYKAGFEYNDFFSPEVYENVEEINHRIEVYKGLGRDMHMDTMHGAFLGLDIAAADSVIRNRSIELYRQSLNIADRLGVGGIVFHTGLIGGLRLDSYLTNWIERSAGFWSEMCKQYPKMTIYMENSFEQEPDTLVRLMKAMEAIDNFKLCFDYGHAILTKTPIEQWVTQMAPYTGHVHLNDNDLKDDLHLVPGQGNIDFNRWNRLRADNGIETTVLLEVSGCDKAEAALKYMRDRYE